MLPSTPQHQIAQCAAAFIVAEGMSQAQAKQHALHQLGLPSKTTLPTQTLMEQAIREYIAIFCADTQPKELLALRRTASEWMLDLKIFKPLIGGAIWNGTATRHSDIHLQLFHDDPKALPIWLLNSNLTYQISTSTGLQHEKVEVYVLNILCLGLNEQILLYLWNNHTHAQRGALSTGHSGDTLRGDLTSLIKRMQNSHDE